MKLTRISVTVIALLLATVARAQEAETATEAEKNPYLWKTNLVADLSLAQAAYSDSWTGGEVGSFSWVGNINGSAEKQLNEWLAYHAQLRLSFGQTVTQDEGSKDWSKPKKTSDLIDWENVGLFLIGENTGKNTLMRVIEYPIATLPVHKQGVIAVRMWKIVMATYKTAAVGI